MGKHSFWPAIFAGALLLQPGQTNAQASPFGYQTDQFDGLREDLVCPSGSVWSQTPPLRSECWVLTSDLQAEIFTFDDYAVSEPISRVRFWGFDLFKVPNGWVECTEPDMSFDIVFYADEGGLPGTELHRYSVIPTRLETDRWFGNGRVNQYEVQLSPPCELLSGWMSIVGTSYSGTGDCWFVWHVSNLGNYASLSWRDGQYYLFDCDRAFCLVGQYGACLVPDAPYCSIQTPAQCATLGGVYVGDGTICDPTDCDANGVPDACDLAFGTHPDADGNGVPDLCDPALALAPENKQCYLPGEQIILVLWMQNIPESIVAGQFFLAYDQAALALISIQPAGTYGLLPSSPFEQELYEAVDPLQGEIDYAVAGADGSSGVSGTLPMAVVVFQALADICQGAVPVDFRAHDPPTYLSDAYGLPVTPAHYFVAPLTVDGQPPAVTACPPDVQLTLELGQPSAQVTWTPAVAEDACTSLAGLIYQLDLESDGDIDYEQDATTFEFPLGAHHVFVQAVDECGNINAGCGFDVLLQPPATLTLEAEQPCYPAGAQARVAIWMRDVNQTIVAGQFFLAYDPLVLDFISATPGFASGEDPENPFTAELFEFVDENAGTIDYAVAQSEGAPGAAGAERLAVFTFQTITDVCAASELVRFRIHEPPTQLSDWYGLPIQPIEINLPALSIDSLPPVVSACPPDLETALATGQTTVFLPWPAPTVVDDCDPAPQLTYLIDLLADGALDDTTAQPGFQFPLGTHRVTARAADACNNFDESCAFLVTVRPAQVLGDLNCDGAVNALDINPFVVAMTDAADYYTRFPTCNIMNADCNLDGAVNALDINPFVRILTGG